MLRFLSPFMPSIDKLKESGFRKRSKEWSFLKTPVMMSYIRERMLSCFYRNTLRVDRYFFENVEKKRSQIRVEEASRGLRVCVKGVLK